MWSSTLDSDFASIEKDAVAFLSGKTVLVTGATGLVGSLLIRFLLYAKYEYGIEICIVAVARNQEKLNEIFGDYCDDVEIIVCNLACDSLCYSQPVDFIVHAAAVTTSREMIERPIDVITLSFVGTQQTLRLAKEKQAKLLYLSSMEVYGTLPDVAEVTEDMLGYIDLSSTRSCYPESKRMCEALCVSYARQEGVDVVIARLAQTFGAGILAGEARSFAQFARSALANNSIVLHTEGLSESNSVYTSDAIAALLLLLRKGISAEAYNIVNEQNHMTVRAMAELCANILSKGVSEVIVEPENAEQHGYAPDVKLVLSSNKIRKLGWEPTVSLAEAFVRLAAYMKEKEYI